MSSHNITGQSGEVLAAAWLTSREYLVLHRNWRHRHWEIDIIASRNNILHFIEVKTRTSLQYGYPEEKVTPKKLKFLIDASAEYLYLNPQWTRVQFDILSINITGSEVKYFLIEDVYE
jgi:putative endonuclease